MAGATHMRLISAGSPAVELDPAARHRLAAQRGHEEAAGRRSHLVGQGGEAHVRVVARVETTIELGEVLVEAVAGMAVAGVDDLDLDQRRGEEPLHLGHRVDEARAVPLGQRVEQRPGEVVAAPVELGPLLPALPREPGGAHPLVGQAPADGHEPVGLEGPQEPAEVAGVEVEPGPEDADVAAVLTDLPEQAALAERSAA